jgi:dTDP-4-dehydrorhamnose 3,5-epimerase
LPVERTPIEGLFVVRWEEYGDERGFFRQTHQVREIEDALGRPLTFVQGNHARSRPGVLRGFHAEPWDKLVYVTRGAVFAAIADIRPDSPTFAEVVTFDVGDPPDAQRVRLFIAEGLANSYCTVGSEDVDYLYDVSAYYDPAVPKRSVAWDDPDLAVEWPVGDPVISDADRANPSLRELFPDRFA